MITVYLITSPSKLRHIHFYDSSLNYIETRLVTADSPFDLEDDEYQITPEQYQLIQQVTEKRP